MNANKTITLAFCLIALALGLSACQSNSQTTSIAPGWQALSDLNWRQHWDSPRDMTWRRDENAEIKVDTDAETGFLVSSQSYANFRLSLEFWIEADTNSGVFIRAADPRDITANSSYEINIWDNHPRQEIRTGAIVNHAFPPLAQVATQGRWNQMEIDADGDHIRAWINGTLTADLRDDTHSGGHIALQWAGPGQLRFRNILISPEN